jgi:undecaprenyl-diphosphatase
MTYLHGILLGIIQGISEFLPISSTAHLTVAGKWLGLINPEHPEQWTAFIAVIQLGTLAAVLVYFLRDVVEISFAFLSENVFSRISFRKQTLQAKLGWYVLIGSLPVGILGIFLKKIIEGHLTKSMAVIAATAIALALVLAAAEITGRFMKNLKSMSRLDALAVGFAQALALIPGSSRSGTTIAAGLFLGMTREAAARFSFLLSIPAVLASGLLEFHESLKFMGAQDLHVMLISTLAAAVSGYAAIAFLLKYLRTHSTFIFVFYRLVFGSGLLWFGVYRHLL